MGTKVMFENVRCAFLVLGEPEDYQSNKKFRWSATGLLPYDSAHYKRAVEVMKAEAQAKWDKKWEAYYDNIIADPKGCCLTDGKKKPDYDGYAGHWALAAHRPIEKGRPLVFGKLKEQIYKPDNTIEPAMAGKLYAGMFVNMQVEFWTQDNANGKAIRATLMGIQVYGQGDAFGGGAPPSADDFGEITEGADADDLG